MRLFKRRRPDPLKLTETGTMQAVAGLIDENRRTATRPTDEKIPVGNVSVPLIIQEIRLQGTVYDQMAASHGRP